MSAKRTTRPKVLMIDEDRKACEALRYALKKRGVRLDAVHDPEEGVAKAGKGKYDLVLLEVRFQTEIKGFEMIEDLRKIASPSEMPVIFLTNAGMAHEVQEGMQAGADAYFVKVELPLSEIADRIAVMLGVMKASEKKEKGLT